MQKEKMRKKIQDEQRNVGLWNQRKLAAEAQLKEADREHNVAVGRMGQLVELFQEMFPGESPFPAPPMKPDKPPVERMPPAREKSA